VILEQVTHGIAVRMAVMSMVMSQKAQAIQSTQNTPAVPTPGAGA
jgi:hypothetical protein